MLGVKGWKARAKLLRQRDTVSPAESIRGFDELSAEYTFIVAVQDEDGNAVSSEAAISNEYGDMFRLAVKFDTPAGLNVGVCGEWLHEEEEDRCSATDAFGIATFDVFVRRASDNKVAHLMTCDFTLSCCCNEVHADCFEKEDVDAMLVSFGTDAPSSAIPPWLGEHVHDSYPNLAWGRSEAGLGFSGADRLLPSGKLTWPEIGAEFDFEPAWAIDIKVDAEAPPPPDDEVRAEEDEPRSGKWTGFLLEFKWHPEGIGEPAENVVTSYFIAQALHGRAIIWL
eukprot:3723713-Prymnesium_polylepis.1